LYTKVTAAENARDANYEATSLKFKCQSNKKLDKKLRYRKQTYR